MVRRGQSRQCVLINGVTFHLPASVHNTIHSIPCLHASCTYVDNQALLHMLFIQIQGYIVLQFQTASIVHLYTAV